MVLITIFAGAYKPTNITGGPHIASNPWIFVGIYIIIFYLYGFVHLNLKKYFGFKWIYGCSMMMMMMMPQNMGVIVQPSRAYQITSHSTGLFTTLIQSFQKMIGGFISLSPTLSGWWYTYLSEKYEFVSWDHYSQYDGKHNPNVWNHQPATLLKLICAISNDPFDFCWGAARQRFAAAGLTATKEPIHLSPAGSLAVHKVGCPQICKWASDMLQICFTPPVFAWACWWITLFDDQLYTNLWSWDERKTRFRASTRMGPRPPQWFARRFQAQRDLGTIWNVNPTYPKILEYLLIKSPCWRLKTTTLKHPTTQSPISE